MTRRAIRAAGAIDIGRIGGPITIIVEDGRIDAIEPGHDHVDGAESYGDGTEVIAAGLIDIHTHGANGVQAIDGDVAALGRLGEFYATHGVTGFLGTIGGSSTSIECGLGGLVALIESRTTTGARCLGIHLEGPFINCCCPGAFDVTSIVAPDIATFERYAGLANGNLRVITVAPEIAGQRDVVAAARRRGIVCSAGHSAATESEMLDMVDLGVTSITHMFNAMPSLHHREPGLVGVGLTDERLVTELIADGVHVDPRVVRLLALTKGWSGVALVSDSIGAAGLPDGVYDFEEREIHVADGQARLADGTLAGSTLTLDRAAENFSLFAGVPWEQALGSASLVPARLLGIDDRKGRVAVGWDADLVAFDANRRVTWTMVDGNVVFESGAQP